MKRFLHKMFVIVAVQTTMAIPVWAGTYTCDQENITVRYRQKSQAVLACEAADQAFALFEQCNIQAPSDKLHIEIVDELPPGCVAQFHCGTGQIEALSPELMEQRREPNGAFIFLPSEEYFQSVIVHELAHAAAEDIPCPFDACTVAAEYVAYAMQIMSMQFDARLRFFEQSDFDRPISRDDLSFIVLMMAPNTFARKVGAHFSQREDPCGFLRDIISGKVVLDRERF